MKIGKIFRYRWKGFTNNQYFLIYVNSCIIHYTYGGKYLLPGRKWRTPRKLFLLGSSPHYIFFELSICIFWALGGGQCCRRFWARGKSLVLCGLLSPCKTLRNFLSPPTAEYGNPAVSGHFCNYSYNSQGSFHTTPFCFETFFVFENVSFVVECPTEPSSPLSLCCPAVLQLKLQQRRTREELVSQGIMPRKYHLLFQHSTELFLGHGCVGTRCALEGIQQKTRATGFILHSSLCFSKFRDSQPLIVKITTLIDQVQWNKQH